MHSVIHWPLLSMKNAAYVRDWLASRFKGSLCAHRSPCSHSWSGLFIHFSCTPSQKWRWILAFKSLMSSLAVKKQIRTISEHIYLINKYLLNTYYVQGTVPYSRMWREKRWVSHISCFHSCFWSNRGDVMFTNNRKQLKKASFENAECGLRKAKVEVLNLNTSLCVHMEYHSRV